MEIKVSKVDDIQVVEIIGDIDGSSAPQAQERILPLVQEPRPVVLAMQGVAYMSSAGLRMLLLLYRQATGNDARVVLVGLSEEIKDTMSATGFLDFFTTCDTVEEGLTAVR